MTSSPHYIHSNGFIERMVGDIKPVLKKAKQTNIDPKLDLLCLRTTPIDAQIPNPAEVLYGEKLRSNPPIKVEFQPALQKTQEILLDRQDQSPELYNKHCGPELHQL